MKINESINPFKTLRIVLTIITLLLAATSLVYLLLLKTAVTPIQVAMHFSLGLLMGVQAIEMVKMRKVKYVTLLVVASLINVVGAAYVLWLSLS